MLDPNLLAARWCLGELSGEDMPGIACQALELGHDGKNLRYLAGLANPTKRDVAETVEGALRELGAQAPITEQEAALWMARRVAGEIIEGHVKPYDGACRISLSYSADVPELKHWSALVTNYEVAAETGEIEEAAQEIIQAAQNLRNGTDFRSDWRATGKYSGSPPKFMLPASTQRSAFNKLWTKLFRK